MSLLRQEYIQGKHPHHLYAKVKHGSFLTFVYAKVKHALYLAFLFVKVKQALFLAFLFVRVKQALFLAFLCQVEHLFFDFLLKIKTV